MKAKLLPLPGAAGRRIECGGLQSMSANGFLFGQSAWLAWLTVCGSVDEVPCRRKRRIDVPIRR